MYAYDVTIKADHVTSNMSEIWNASLGVLRGGLLLHLFERKQRKVMVLIAIRNQETNNLDTLQPKDIMLDRQKEILSTLEIELPRSPLRYCARHILANTKFGVK